MEFLRLCFLLPFLWVSLSWADEVNLAVAANFAGVAEKLADNFSTQTHHSIKVISDSSAKLLVQIHQGAPFDIFLSANTQAPQSLLGSGLALDTSYRVYAIGRLVLWSPQNPAVADGALLKEPQRRLAMANPEFAPYGEAAMQVLDSLQLKEGFAERLVMEKNLAQTYQAVRSHHVDAGFIALSQLKQPDAGGFSWLVPENLHQPIRQAGLVLKNAKNNSAALAFWGYLQEPESRKLIEGYGYQVPE